MNSIDLDDIAYLERIDPAGMAARVAELPRQCSDARELAEACSLPIEFGLVDAIVITGLGGSAIAGDLVRTLVRDECSIPIFVNRDYDLPAFVDEHTLVIASSYSGNTEETLAAFAEAVERGAWTLAITTGGKLAKICRERRLPLLTFDYDAQPRAALGFSLVPLFVILQRLSFVHDRTAELDQAIGLLENLQRGIGIGVPERENRAKQLARWLEGRFPIVYAAGHLSEVGRRWKCQFNENSKGWGFWEVWPELNHNAVAGYEFPAALAGEVRVVMLSSELYRPRHRVRLEVTGEILAEQGITHEVIDVQGETPLAQALWAIHLGDYVTLYLAMLRGVDPTPVKMISYLKERLAQVP
jgi:glucose/mannose-6-phosphate isomerase